MKHGVFLAATCGGTYIGQSGALHSPGFPESNYPDSSSCEWYLEGPTGHYLTLTFGNFSLQSSAGCSADYVEIRDYNASGKNICTVREALNYIKHDKTRGNQQRIRHNEISCH